MTDTSDPPKSKPDQAVSFLYAMRSGDYVKIGHARNVQRRLTAIQISTPETVTLIHDQWDEYDHMMAPAWKAARTALSIGDTGSTNHD